MNVMSHEFDGIADTLSTDAQAISINDSILTALRTKSSSGAVLALASLTRALQVDAAMVFDATGKVVTSTENFDLGDDVSTNTCVAAALQGNTITTVDESGGYAYGINVAEPVYQSNRLIGGIMVSYDLSDHQFVDSLKEMTGDDFTIFQNDVSLSSTIKDSKGNRVVGKKLDEKIAGTILKNGKDYTGRAVINGVRYIASYAPITTGDGSITGIIFSGYNLTEYYQTIFRTILLTILCAVVMMILVVLYGTRFMKKRLKRPLESVVSAVNDIASGEMSDKTSQTLAALSTKDEIGQLARSMEQAVDSVRKISTDTQYLEQAMERNDLTVSVNTDSHRGIYKLIADVVSRLFNEIAKNMKEIQTISGEIDNRTVQVSEAAQSLAQGSTEQAGSVEELASTINSIVTQVNTNADNAQGAYQASQEAERQVASSNEQMENMMRAMDEISKTSERISEIVKTIDGLAFQTNLLALNAAVEAARAGAQGKGFAVVADEVQNLAGKSATAAKNTAELIESSLAAIKKGTEYAQNAEKAMKSVVGKTTDVNQMVSKISDATSQEAQMLHQVSEGIDQISVVVQQNSSIAEETAAASQGLTAETKQLNEMVGRYQFK
jgi:methyl-accepting chemotaxis protein